MKTILLKIIISSFFTRLVPHISISSIENICISEGICLFCFLFGKNINFHITQSIFCKQNCCCFVVGNTYFHSDLKANHITDIK